MDSVIGIDVGTGSARGCAFDLDGNQISEPEVLEIKTLTASHDDNVFYMQSSEDIFNKVQMIIKKILAKSKLNVKAIGCDATCSLVLLDKNKKGIILGVDDEVIFDIILWRDHRAVAETTELNSVKLKAHSFVGGAFSSEMEIPKLMWLKRNYPKWNEIDLAFDLADFLTFRLTGENARSVCPLVCKWGWIAGDCVDGKVHGDWEDELIQLTGLTELRHLARGKILPTGVLIGEILPELASDLNLDSNVAIGSGLIDAHAGALGVLKLKPNSGESRIAVIAGTSNCHMMVIDDCSFVPGVWGPYKHAVTENTYLLEGGQTSAGSTMDWIVKTVGKTFADFAEIKDKELDILVIPDFHGNRSPLANPNIRGSIHGLNLETTPDDLFLGAIQGLALGTRQIINQIESVTMKKIHSIVLTGGLSKSLLFNQVHANACGIPVLIPDTEHGVLLGAAMSAASAGGIFSNLSDAQNKMSPKYETINPSVGMAMYYNRKFDVFVNKLNQSF